MKPRPEEIKDLTYAAWPPGTEEKDKQSWMQNSPIIIWARTPEEARKKLKVEIEDADDWEIEEFKGNRLAM